MGNKTFLEKLSDKIWKTKKARFAAAKRMERYYYFSNVSMALTSVSIVGVNLLPFLDGCSNKSSLITILTIIFSVYVLVISLLSTQARFDKKAENYHACGCELTEYNDILQLYIEENRTLNIEEKEVLNVVEAYSNALTLLDDYDHGCVSKTKGKNSIYQLTYEECRILIDSMGYGGFSSVFGVEKNQVN